MNTNEKLKEAIKENMLMLPKEAQEAMNSFDWLSEAEKIGKENNLTEDEINDFQAEVALALVGLTDPTYFTQNIENEVGTSKEEAKKITDKALEKIFKPIADKVEESVKNKIKDKNPKWDQNVKFALSGGNYSFFAERAGTTNVLDETPKRIIPVYPASDETSTQKIEDIRSKFTI